MFIMTFAGRNCRALSITRPVPLGGVTTWLSVGFARPSEARAAQRTRASRLKRIMCPSLRMARGTMSGVGRDEPDRGGQYNPIVLRMRTQRVLDRVLHSGLQRGFVPAAGPAAWRRPHPG